MHFYAVFEAPGAGRAWPEAAKPQENIVNYDGSEGGPPADSNAKPPEIKVQIYY